MDKQKNKFQVKQKRKFRIRKRVSGTSQRPRLSLKLTNKQIIAQCIDDTKGETLVYLSSLASKEIADSKLKPNVQGCEEFAKHVGEKLKAKNISQVVFYRAERKYHGTVKAFADAVRACGVEF